MPKRLEYAPAVRSLREARSTRVPVERRAADYLHAAAISAPMLGNGSHPTTARDSYNTAAADLTILLRSSEGGRLWNHPLLLNNGSETYHLRFQLAP
jgi:hypothetical protein